MKKIYFICLLLASSLVVSCSKDDDKPLSFMEFRGKHYKLKEASFSYIIKYSDSLTKFGASFSSLKKTD